MLSTTFIDEMRAKLLEAKDKFESDLAELHAHTELGDDEDSSSDEIQIDEASQDMMEKFTNDLEKIEKALQKIDDGTYGTDEEGNEISEARLRALPWADKAL